MRSVLASVLSACVCSAVTYGFLSVRITSIEESLRHTPPVAVVDYVGIASRYPGGASPEELEAVMVKTNAAIIALRDAGYMVIDAAALAAYPEDIAFPADLVVP